MDLSIIVTTYGRPEKVIRLLDGIFASNLAEIQYEVVVVDDCSGDNVVDAIRDRFGDRDNFCILVNEVNSKVSRSRNHGVERSTGEWVLFIDDDVVVGPESIRALYEASKQHPEAILTPVMYEYMDKGAVWFAGISYNHWTTMGTFINKNPGELSCLAETFPTDLALTMMGMPRSAFEASGPFDETLFPFQFEELDLCIRARLHGHEIWVVKHSKVYHDHSTGSFLNVPWRLHMTVRNRFFTARLWASSPLEEMSALAASIAHAVLYTGVKLLVYRRNMRESLVAIGKGTWEGILGLRGLVPYRKRDFNHIND